MRFFPRTRIGWCRFTLLPFKVYVAVAFPMACLLPEVDGRHGWNFSLIKVLPGYLVCFFVLFLAGLLERVCHLEMESTFTFLFAVAALFIYFGPWFNI